MPEHSEVELLGRNWDSEKLSDLYNMLHWIRVTYVCVCVYACAKLLLLCLTLWPYRI